MARVRLYAHGAECKQCQVVRQFLIDHTIRFEEFDIDRSRDALQELVELTGSATHVPVITVDQETFVDFNEDIAAKVLELTTGK
jgi:glutaredoxin